MSTSPSALSGSSSAPTTYFTGMSTFSSSLNTAISQEVQIASLPYELLQDNVTTMTSQANELQTLAGDVTNVQSAVTSLASASGNMLSASVSDGSATATVGSGATAGSYSLQVTNLGSNADALSVEPSSSNTLTTVTDPTSQNITTSGSYTLTVGSATTNVSYSGGNLNGLAQAIDNANAGVQATVVDVGSSSAPDYRLSLQSDQLGPMTIQLNDGHQNLLAASGSAGTLAQYTINGQQVESDSDTVTLAPGLTAQLTGTNSTPATVTVAADPSGIASALQSFVSAYNSAVTELGKNRGQSGGALAGDSIVYEITDSLQGLANYSTGDGAVNSLATLGVTFDDTTGQLSFDQGTFDSATSGQTDALTQFLGSATSTGFLETATNAMTGLLDPTTGILTNEYNTIAGTITSTNTQIANEQAQVTQLQTNLTQQMAAADTMIYDLQQQSSQLQGIFTAEQDSEIEAASV
jgi:flagellar hook-associated protein 2